MIIDKAHVIVNPKIFVISSSILWAINGNSATCDWTSLKFSIFFRYLLSTDFYLVVAFAVVVLVLENSVRENIGFEKRIYEFGPKMLPYNINDITMIKCSSLNVYA